MFPSQKYSIHKKMLASKKELRRLKLKNKQLKRDSVAVGKLELALKKVLSENEHLRSRLDSQRATGIDPSLKSLQTLLKSLG